MQIKISYTPNPNQYLVHQSKARFKIVAAGRRSGKTTMAVNELIRQALSHPEVPGKPTPRSWFVCATYKQAEMIAWKAFLKFIPEELIKRKHHQHLEIELINGHLIELKGSEDPDRLRGVALVFVVLDEYGLMPPEIWTDVIRPMLVDFRGSALFIGTPGPDGSPHFHEMYNLGKIKEKDHEAWLFFTKDNTSVPGLQEEVERARLTMPADIFKREFEADFDTTAGLIYDNFKHITHVIPNYAPTMDDFVVGSIDPGMNNPTGALLVAWDKDGVGRQFREYYQSDTIAEENAKNIADMAKGVKVAYWVIDRASTKRDPTNGLTVYGKYAKILKPLVAAPNDPGTVWAGIDEVKKLLHCDPLLKTPRYLISALCQKTLWEMGRYIRYKRRWHADKNEEEKPRKLNDHLMDCIRNMVYTKPWIRPSLRVYEPQGAFYK